ncbi:hypothetical protein D9619_013743 [Psilocybe cf. subviscida]|uniref:Uncharacterized protein n=1 Tax=Psilocybe cf. subviscida TaxID=2480587 RepID=A0A8H5AZL1_9AGAR|nr:hypothetical protein D9619_013743 [Psilocybe cf. subviscida]
MAPLRIDDGGSDLDLVDGLSPVKTVLLGVLDGAVQGEADRIDAPLSSISGLPVHASPVVMPKSRAPANGSARADVASLQEQPHGPRAVHLGLHLGSISRAMTSVGAFSCIRTNEAHTQKLAKKHVWQAQRERDHTKAEERPWREKPRKAMLGDRNLFAMGAKAASTMPASGAVLGIDMQIFGEVPASSVSRSLSFFNCIILFPSRSDALMSIPGSSPAKGNNKDGQDYKNEDSEDEDDEGKELLAALQQHQRTNLRGKRRRPTHHPTSPRRRNALVDALLDDDDGEKGRSGKGGEQGTESWVKENSMDVDQVTVSGCAKYYDTDAALKSRLEMQCSQTPPKAAPGTGLHNRGVQARSWAWRGDQTVCGRSHE